ncbi:MAG TPA: hypothetical protein DCY13_19315, partial [Verrucomicrobiales bacterium]|nr:hypothetical protein [Verrucomicrobiales bacterium]
MKLEVTLPNSDGKWNYTSDLEIRVPASLAMEARNGFGDLEVAQLSGDVVLENQHGKLLVRDVSGKVNAQTSFADLAANTIGPARLRNQHGEIEVEKVAGELDAETSFSSLKAADIKGAARVRNQHGSIEVRTASALDARTSYGPLLA